MRLYISGIKEIECLLEALYLLASISASVHDYEKLERLQKIIDHVENCRKMQNNR